MIDLLFIALGFLLIPWAVLPILLVWSYFRHLKLESEEANSIGSLPQARLPRP